MYAISLNHEVNHKIGARRFKICIELFFSDAYIPHPFSIKATIVKDSQLNTCTEINIVYSIAVTILDTAAAVFAATGVPSGEAKPSPWLTTETWNHPYFPNFLHNRGQNHSYFDMSQFQEHLKSTQNNCIKVWRIRHIRRSFNSHYAFKSLLQLNHV